MKMVALYEQNMKWNNVWVIAYLIQPSFDKSTICTIVKKSISSHDKYLYQTLEHTANMYKTLISNYQRITKYKSISTFGVDDKLLLV